MKYFSLNTVIRAYKETSENTKDKFWGILAILYSIDQFVAPCVSFSIDTTKLSSFLENLFRLTEKKTYENTGSYYSVVFAQNWEEIMSQHFLTGKPDIMPIIVWAYRNTPFESEFASQELFEKFLNDFHLSKDVVEKIFTINLESFYFELQNGCYKDEDLFLELGGQLSSNNSTIKLNKTFVVANAGDLSRGPFFQPLYASLNTLECLIIFPFDAELRYTVFPSDTKKHKSNIPSGNIINNLQLIYFGAPGTGKSYIINKIANEDNSIRTTFHPDSDYSTFVGCYKPVKNPVSNEITYEFVPQAFTTAYINAWSNLDNPYYLVIEEINRGNCAQIFGDIFQLLDRNEDGFSSYKITPDMDLQQYLWGKFEDIDIEDKEIKTGVKMQLPANLHILATMNTSDQSLFPIDSAFKRRWDWKYIPIDYTDNGHYISCGEKSYKWVDFLEKVNMCIESVTQSEDKKMGGWFVKPVDKEITADKFVSKVVFYLWNDIFKDFAHNGNTIFKDEFKNFNSFFDFKGDVRMDVLENFLESLNVSYDIKIFSEEDYNEATNLSKAKYTYNGVKLTLGGIANKIVYDFANDHPEMNATAIKDYFVNLCKGIGIAHVVETDEEYRRRADQKSAARSRSEVIIPNGEKIHVSTQWNAKKENDNFIRFIEICRKNNLGEITPIS